MVVNQLLCASMRARARSCTSTYIYTVLAAGQTDSEWEFHTPWRIPLAGLSAVCRQLTHQSSISRCLAPSAPLTTHTGTHVHTHTYTNWPRCLCALFCYVVINLWELKGRGSGVIRELTSGGKCSGFQWIFGFVPVVAACARTRPCLSSYTCKSYN